MAGGSGVEWDPGKDLENLASDPVGTIANALVNVTTGGMIGLEDGQITQGTTLRAGSEILGNVTGANAARKAAMQTQDAINEARAASEKERQGQIQRQEATERQISGRGASQLRRSQRTATSGTGTSGVEQQMTIDFLGL